MVTKVAGTGVQIIKSRTKASLRWTVINRCRWLRIVLLDVKLKTEMKSSRKEIYKQRIASCAYHHSLSFGFFLPKNMFRSLNAFRKEREGTRNNDGAKQMSKICSGVKWLLKLIRCAIRRNKTHTFASYLEMHAPLVRISKSKNVKYKI